MTRPSTLARCRTETGHTPTPLADGTDDRFNVFVTHKFCRGIQRASSLERSSQRVLELSLGGRRNTVTKAAASNKAIEQL